MSKRKQPTKMLKRKVWPNSNVTSTTLPFSSWSAFCHIANGKSFCTQVEWLATVARRTSTTSKLTNDVVRQKQTGRDNNKKPNETLPKKRWSSRLLRDWKWQLTDVGWGGSLGFGWLLKLSNLIPIAVKHFDIWSGWFRFFFIFLKHFCLWGGRRRRKKWRHSRGGDDGRWLTTMKKAGESQTDTLYI